MEIHTLFCEIHDFCIEFEPKMNRHLIADGNPKRLRKSTLALSEVMTIIVGFHRSQIEHTRHRSGFNFLVNVVSALIGYTYQEKKPSLNIRLDESAELPAIVL